MTSQATASVAPPSLLARLLGSSLGPAGTLLRVALAVVLFPHGAQKALGWFGGYGWSGTMGYLTGTAGLPTVIAALVITIEFAGSLALLAGAATRLAASGVIAVMIGAIVKVHAANGFFMNWFGAQAGEGFEYHLLVIGMAAALLIGGGGAASVDGRLARKFAS